jgi:hypothetical protein
VGDGFGWEVKVCERRRRRRRRNERSLGVEGVED